MDTHMSPDSVVGGIAGLTQAPICIRPQGNRTLLKLTALDLGPREKNPESHTCVLHLSGIQV